jgi:hypothetical protein
MSRIANLTGKKSMEKLTTDEKNPLIIRNHHGHGISSTSWIVLFQLTMFDHR